MMEEHSSPDVPVLEVRGLEHRIQNRARGDIFVVNVDAGPGKGIVVYPGCFAAILGDSGCGKTTLLSILGLLRRPYRPDQIETFRIAGLDRNGDTEMFDIADLWKRNRQGQIERLRRQLIGFALQTGDLLSSLTVRENIGVPVRLNGATESECNQRVDHLLREFRLEGKANARINVLSGGEYQRVVLARAIAHRPRIAFVDEPTSALNKKLARKALHQLKESIHAGDPPGAVIMITHDEGLAMEFADTIIRMEPELVPAAVGPGGHRAEPGSEVAAGRVVEVVDRRKDMSGNGRDL